MKMMKRTSAETLRKLKIGGVARLITIVVLAVIVLVNVLASIILASHPVKLDMTTDDFFGISDKTKSYIQSLDSEIEIILLAEKETFSQGGAYYKQVVETIEEITLESDKITTDYVDLVKTPGFAANFPSESLETGMLIVKSKKTGRHIVLEAGDYFNQVLDTNTYTYNITASQAEAAITAAIINATNEDPKLLGVISGHGEEDISGLTSLLQKNGYTIKENVTLYSGKLDDDYDGLIISAPARDFTNEEIDLLESYMKNNEEYEKNIFYFASTTQQKLPNLETFLLEWGFEFSEGTVYETDAAKRLSVYPYISALSYADNSFTGGLEYSSVALIAPYSRPMNLAFEEKGDYKTTKFAGYTNTAVVMPNDVNPATWDPDKAEMTGPFAAVAVSKLSKYDYTDENVILTRSSNIYAFTTPLFCTEKVVSSTSYANGQYVLGLFDERFNRNAEVSVVPKVATSKTMNMTQLEALIIGLIFAVILPLALAVTGVVIYFRRRHS
jgi:hypothetical protein